MSWGLTSLFKEVRVETPEALQRPPQPDLPLRHRPTRTPPPGPDSDLIFTRFRPEEGDLRSKLQRRKKRTQPPPKENLLRNFSGPKEKLSRPVVDTKPYKNQKNPSKTRDLGLFSVPFLLCPLRRLGTHFWRTFWVLLGFLFVANPLCPPTPFRNL